MQPNSDATSIDRTLIIHYSKFQKKNETKVYLNDSEIHLLHLCKKKPHRTRFLFNPISTLFFAGISILPNEGPANIFQNLSRKLEKSRSK